MSLFIEVGKAQLNKKGEELCGDSVETAGTETSRIVVLADGLGSGVKANILSGLTSKMAAKMLEGGCTVDEVIESLAQTLPMCEVRGLAYSTFSIAQVLRDGRVYLAEYDNPPAFMLNGSSLRTVERHARVVAQRSIKEALFTLQDGDWVVMVSDGVLHAGIGGVWNLGWGWDRVADYIKGLACAEPSAQDLADQLVGVCHKLYGGHPGDDTTVVTMRVRKRRWLSLMVGPPADRGQDSTVVAQLLGSPGRKGVCGGTTGNIAARYLNADLAVDLKSMDERVPPTGVLPGIDLVTEGMLTLTYTLANLKKGLKAADLHYKRDGASRLTLQLLDADNVDFMVGRAINPAHQSPDMPADLALKNRVVEEIVQILRGMGKTVEVNYY